MNKERELFKDSVALVEADRFATHALWLMNAVDGKQYCNIETNRVDWESIPAVTMEIIG